MAPLATGRYEWDNIPPHFNTATEELREMKPHNAAISAISYYLPPKIVTVECQHIVDEKMCRHIVD